MVNHFNGNTKITRKVELCRNLRNLIWFRNVDMFSFFPRCYDLCEINDLDDFVEDFKLTRVLNHIIQGRKYIERIYIKPR